MKTPFIGKSRGSVVIGTTLALALLVARAPIVRAQSPVPLIHQPLVPDATAPGGPQFTLTVNGTGFVSNSIVNWNGIPLATTFVSGSQLTATVPAANIATAGTASVTVVSPAPGGDTSNMLFFTVTNNAGPSIGFGLVTTIYWPGEILLGRHREFPFQSTPACWTWWYRV
jgi:IPT/TIG domain